MSDNPWVLIVEDEHDLAELIAHHLRQEGFEVKIASNGRKGLESALEDPPDLMILDLMLPEIGGLEVCRRVRSHPRAHRTPILMLTAKGEEIDRVVGFEVGADDYITKPFSPRELVLRVKAILKRYSPPFSAETPKDLLRHGPLLLDLTRHRVFVEEKEVSLTATEFKLLQFLLENRGRVLTRDVLLDRVWGYESEITTRTVDTHVKRLREKLGNSGGWIDTVRGVGYRFQEI